jgi:hypothetical protein
MVNGMYWTELSILHLTWFRANLGLVSKLGYGLPNSCCRYVDNNNRRSTLRVETIAVELTTRRVVRHVTWSNGYDRHQPRRSFNRHEFTHVELAFITQ